MARSGHERLARLVSHFGDVVAETDDSQKVDQGGIMLATTLQKILLALLGQLLRGEERRMWHFNLVYFDHDVRAW